MSSQQRALRGVALGHYAGRCVRRHRTASTAWLVLAVLAAGVAQGATFTGTVFEDANYGGGAGRTLAASGGAVLANVRVELYRLSSGAFIATTTTNAAGVYSFNTGNSSAAMRVRVVNGTVRSARIGGACVTCVPVQTFRTDATSGAAVAVTNRVGGEDPAVSDAVVNPGADSFGSLTAGGRVPQSITTAAPLGNNVTVSGIDFGFNFDTVVNTRDAANCAATNSSYPCQGSLRQFAINANALGGEGGLAQSGSGQLDGANSFLPSGAESSIFMIPAAQLTGGVAVIALAAALPAISGANTRLDATTQSVNIGNTNAGTLGTGGTVGVDAVFLPTFPRPEVQLSAGNTILTLSGINTAALG